MKKTNIVAVFIASLSVILLSNGIFASADNASRFNGAKARGEQSKDVQNGLGLHVGMGMMGGMFGAGPDEKNTTVSVEKIDGGIRITKTSIDSDTVTKLQKTADDFNLQKSITRTVTNIKNGIEITTTSDNADAVKLIKERMTNKSDSSKKDGKISISTEELTNGIKETITSADAEIVKRLQEGKGYGMGMGYGKPDFKNTKHGAKAKFGKGQSGSQTSGEGN